MTWRIINKVIIVLVLGCMAVKPTHGQNVKGYLITFGCCFKNDSVVIKNPKRTVYSGIINTESSTSIDVKSAAFLKPGKKEVKIILGNKITTLMTEKVKEVVYVYVYHYNDSLYYNTSSKPIYGY